ncbi:MAG TPA: hypothetical protein PLZ74_10160, partial [Kiritimatiellia bacterium]|nr:hypothetical protein [Kiritimatiellia bacterium]
CSILKILSSCQFVGKELGVFSLRHSEFGVGRSAFKGGGVKRRPDEQTLVPPILRQNKKICAICKSADKTSSLKTRCCGQGRPRSLLTAPLFTRNA